MLLRRYGENKRRKTKVDDLDVSANKQESKQEPKQESKQEKKPAPKKQAAKKAGE